ncbi:MAG: hypothetical protein ABWZ41_02785 [Burkholderiales bacterium]
MLFAAVVACSACALLAPVASAQSSLHCDDLSVTVQSGESVALSPVCSDPTPVPETALAYFVIEEPLVGSIRGDTSALSYRALSGYVGIVSFTFAAVETVIGTYTIAKTSNTATATVNVVAAPVPPAPDRDGDQVPDTWDGCPDEPETARPAGWRWAGRPGCAPPIAPFTRAAAKPSQRAAIKAFVKLWRNRDERARAMRRRIVDVPFDMPVRTAGTGRVRAGLNIRPRNIVRGPHLNLAFGEVWCTPGRRCVVHAKLDPAAVRRYAREPLTMSVGYAVFAPKRELRTRTDRRIRMPLH